MQLFEKLHKQASQKFKASGDDVPISDWITQHTTLAKKPFTFKRYPFQEQIASDMHPNMTVIKCSQIGLTEIQVRKFFAFLRRMNGVSGIFTLPTEDMAKRVYTTRMSPMLRADEVFNPPMEDKPVRRQDLVQVQDSWGYITPCIEGPATSIPADILFHDELDLSDEAMIGLFQSRLQDSDYKITQSFSTPTYMGHGVDKNFQITDQFHYLVRCEACGHHQFPLFTHDFIHIPDMNFEVEHLTDMTAEQITGLNLKEAYVKCKKCSGRLDLSNTDYREWVAKFPSKDTFRGYKVNPFSTDRITLEYILTQLSKFKMQENEKGFHNTVLGQAYSPASAQIPEEGIKACMSAHARPVVPGWDRGVFMGIDMGTICHISLVGEHTDGKDPWFLFKTCHVSQLPAVINELQKEYNIIQGCVDRYPFTPEVDSLRINTNSMLMPISYGGHAVIQPKKDELGDIIYYHANRTFMLDMVRTSITNNIAVLNGYSSHKDTLVVHLRDMVREEQADKEPTWIKLTGNDHFFHSMAYALLARRVAEHQFLQSSSKSGMVLSMMGMDVGKRNDPTNRFGNKGVNKYGFIG